MGTVASSPRRRGSRIVGTVASSPRTRGSSSVERGWSAGRVRPLLQCFVLLHRGNLYLVGLPGAGKSTLGRQLARRLAKTFVDADAELERKLGVSIPTIFEIEGEASFRDREEAALAEIAALSNIVLATGGAVVYLHALPETLRERTRRSRQRPLLNTGDPLARLTELYAARDPLYREVAECVVESDRGEIARFSRELEDAFRQEA